MSTIFPSSTEINKIILADAVGQKWRAYIFVDHALIGNHSKYFNIYIALRDIGLLTTCKPHLKIMDHKRIFPFHPTRTTTMYLFKYQISCYLV